MPPSRIVIIGGGFAGMSVARRLARHRSCSVELIDAKNYFVFQPFLPEVAGGAVNPLDTVTPLRLILPKVEVRTAIVRAIHLDSRTVEMVEGGVGTVRHLTADHLVLAFGQVIDLGRFPGLADHAFTVRQAADSYALRDHVIDCLEQACYADAATRRRLLTFVVVGGGFSGIEVLGEVHELALRSLRFYPRLKAGELRFVLVDVLRRILPELSENLANYAVGELRRRGIEFMLGHGVKSATSSALELDDGTLIGTRTIVATIGNGPSPLARELGVRLERGRIKVAADMALPDFPNVWALGDAAAIPLDDRIAPPTAQAAVREAELLADNILASMAGRPTKPFTFRSRGTIASLGGGKAVAEVMGMRLAGRLAWLLWRLAYVAMLPAWSTRLRVMAEQALDLVLPRSTVRTSAANLPPSRFVHHRPGDVVIRPGELGDGVHLVLEGAYASSDGPVFRPGDQFGIDEIVAGRPHRDCIKATEPSRCFVLRRDEFERIFSALTQAGRSAVEVQQRFLAGR